MNNNSYFKVIIEFVIALVTAIIVFIIINLTPTQIIRQFEEQTYDWRFERKIARRSVNPPENNASDIIIIDINDSTLQQLGPFEKWPLTYHARLINWLKQVRPAAIGFHVPLPEQALHDTSGMDSLIQAIQTARNVVFAVPFGGTNPDKLLLPMKTAPQPLKVDKLAYPLGDSTANNLPVFSRFEGKCLALYNAAARIGFSNLFSGEHRWGSTIRSVPLFVNFGGKQYPSFATSMMLAVTDSNTHIHPDSCRLRFMLDSKGRLVLKARPRENKKPVKLRIPIDDHDQMRIDYQGRHQAFQYFPYEAVLRSKVPPRLLKGKTILIGMSAKKLFKWHAVSFQDELPTIEIQANIIHSLLKQSFIRRVGALWLSVFIFMLILLISFLTLKMKIRLLYTIMLGLLLLTGYIFLALFLFIHANLWLEIGVPVFIDFPAFLSIIGFRYLLLEKEGKLIKKFFSNAISSEAVDTLLRHPEQLEFVGEERVGTILFAKIKNFNAVTRHVQPAALFALLNDYLSAMLEIILKYNGYLDKYSGEEIKAIFNIPVTNENHAKNACLAALEMQERLSQLRVKWELEKRPQLTAQIGLHTGSMIVGNIGGEKRFDYTVIGSNITLAKHLELANENYGTSIIISEEIYEKIKKEVTVRELDFVGFNEHKKPLCIYELIASKDAKTDEKMLVVLENFAKGLSVYRAGNWELAYNKFQKALRTDPNDGPSQTFFNRCKRFIEEQRYVPPDWDGVYEVI